MKTEKIEISKVIKIVKSLSQFSLIVSIFALYQSGSIVLSLLKDKGDDTQIGQGVFIIITMLLFFSLSIASFALCVRLKNDNK